MCRKMDFFCDGTELKGIFPKMIGLALFSLKLKFSLLKHSEENLEVN